MAGRPAGRAARPLTSALAPVLLALTASAVLTGCHVTVDAGPAGAPRTPRTEQPCPSRTPASPSSPLPTPAPVSTKLPWRAATMPDGSVRMTVGDIDLAPAVHGAASLADYRAPGDDIECEQVRILRAHGWWCTTTVAGIVEQGEIVVGGAAPRARIRSTGRPAFRTMCGGTVPRHRQRYAIERDSWSGYRAYARRAFTPWTTAGAQSGPSVSTPCPAGRVGTYNYRLAVTVEVDGYTADPSEAAGAPLRKDCGTGVS